MTPNGVSTAGHAGSHAWGDCVRHRSLRVTMQRSMNQESHGLSRVECQLCAERLMCGRSRCVDPSSRRGSPDARRPARHPPGGPRGQGRRPVASLAIVILLALSSAPTNPVGLSAPATPPLYSLAASRAARPARCAHGGRRPTAVLYRSFVVRCTVARPCRRPAGFLPTRRTAPIKAPWFLARPPAAPPRRRGNVRTCARRRATEGSAGPATGPRR